MQSLQSSGLQSIISTDEFLTQVAWPGVQPSPSGGGGTSAAQEPEPIEEQTPAAEDELIPPKPFIPEPDAEISQEEAAPASPAHILEDTQPSTPAPQPEHLIV